MTFWSYKMSFVFNYSNIMILINEIDKDNPYLKFKDHLSISNLLKN